VGGLADDLFEGGNCAGAAQVFEVGGAGFAYTIFADVEFLGDRLVGGISICAKAIPDVEYGRVHAWIFGVQDFVEFGFNLIEQSI